MSTSADTTSPIPAVEFQLLPTRPLPIFPRKILLTIMCRLGDGKSRKVCEFLFNSLVEPNPIYPTIMEISLISSLSILLLNCWEANMALFILGPEITVKLSLIKTCKYLLNNVIGQRIDYVLCSSDMKTWFGAANIQEGLMVWLSL